MDTAYENRRIALIIFGIILALTALNFAAVRPPAAVGVDAPETDFASGRALRHLEQIAAAPTPIGSEQHEQVKQYLIDQLEQLGLEPQVQSTSAYNPDWRSTGNVENIIVRIPGTANSKAVLLVAHYDTLAQVPGASSSKAGIAAVLEVLRMLQLEQPLKNDLIILFADGGESGLLGSLAFLEQHPWAENLGLVINPMARGTSGPVMMTDSTYNNSWTLPQFAEAVDKPIANSLNNEINRWLLSDTDFSVFKRAGIPGFQLAFWESERHYQTALDNLANLDQRSLQHLGTYLYQLVKHFGSIDIETTEEPDLAANQVYFDLFGRIIIRYPVGVVARTLSLVVILFGVTCWFGVKAKKAEAKGIALGVVLLLGAVLLSVVATRLLASFVQPFHPLYQYIPLAYGTWYFAALVGVISLIFFLLYNWALNKYNLLDLYLGAVGLWVLATILVSLLFPGASYAFVLPLVFGLAAALVVIAREQLSWVARLILLLVSALPLLILWPNLILNLYYMLGFTLLSLLTFLVVLVLGMLLPQWEKIIKWQKLVLPLLAVAVAAAGFGFSIVNAGVSQDNPQMDTLLYFVDLDRDSAYWVSLDIQPDDFTKQVLGTDFTEANLGEFIPYENIPALSRRVEFDSSLMDDPVTVELLSDSISDDSRELVLRIKADSAVNNILIFIEPELLVDAVVLNQETTVEWNAYWPMLRCYNLDAEGITLTIPAAADQPFSIKILSQSLGLPELGLQPRPEYIIAAPTAITDSTFTAKSYHF